MVLMIDRYQMGGRVMEKTTGERGLISRGCSLLSRGICGPIGKVMTSIKSLACRTWTMLHAVSCFLHGIVRTGPIWTTVIIALLLWNSYNLRSVQGQLDRTVTANRQMLSGVLEYKESQISLIDVYRNDLRDLVWQMSFQQADSLCRARLKNHEIMKDQVEVVQAYYGRGN